LPVDLDVAGGVVAIVLHRVDGGLDVGRGDQTRQLRPQRGMFGERRVAERNKLPVRAAAERQRHRRDDVPGFRSRIRRPGQNRYHRGKERAPRQLMSGSWH
jgi:hypothetical protein